MKDQATVVLAARTVVVSLKRRFDRRRNFEKQATEIGLARWAFFDAFDGQSMGLSSTVGRSWRDADRPKRITAGEIGCFLSHMSIVRCALAANLRTLAVLEDDVEFAPAFARRWQEFLTHVPEDWQMLHLGIPESHVEAPVASNAFVHRLAGRTWGTYLYLMRRSAMARFAAHEHADSMQWPIDVILSDVQRQVPTYGPREALISLTDKGSDCALDAATTLGKWNAVFEGVEGPQPFGDSTTYERGAAFLEELPVEDWGCGLGWFRKFARGRYTGLDGSHSEFVDRIVDLRSYTSATDGLLMRHVLEHNPAWRRILQNALTSFTKRMVLVLFTPLASATREIGEAELSPGVRVPILAFAREDIVTEFRAIPGLRLREESLPTATQYGTEHVFYAEKHS